MSTRLLTPSCRVSVVLAALCVLITLPRMSPAQGLEGGGLDPAVQREIEYADALYKMGLPDYSKIVMDRIKDPAAGPAIKVLRLKALVSKGEWDAVIKIISGEVDKDSPGVWAMKMTLADGYYAWGKYPEAKSIYESLLKKYPDGPPAALKSFYTESLYKYAQMLLLIGDEANAVRIYETLAKVEMPRHVNRQIITETAELMIKLYEKADKAKRVELRKKIEVITTKILWVQDIWFGKAIVILAHLSMIDGDVDAAMELIDDYKTQLLNIDQILAEEEARTGEPMTKLSPMAQCRYLLGVMMQERAQKLIDENGNMEEVKQLLAGKKRARGGRAPGALQHFINVFAKYPATSWAPDAGARANEVEARLVELFDAKITTNITPERMKEVERYQFQNARTLYNQNQYKEAAEAYVKVLNIFPETESSVAALGELARCYVEMDEELYAEMVVRYLAERFSLHPEFSNKAGDQVVRVAMMYAERNQPALRDRVYDSFFQFFPKHPTAPGTLYRMAERKFEQENYEGALIYFEQIKENHSGIPLWFAAMNRITTCYSRLEQPAKEIKALQSYIEGLETRERPGQQLISARYREALAYKRLGPKYLVSSYNRLLQLEKILRGAARAKYEENPEQKQANDEVLQGVLYNKAGCYTLLPPPKGKTDTYRKLQALKALEEVVETFPKSRFAANALSQIGTIWTVLEKPKEAGDALKRLQKDYPDSPEAQNALFMLGMNLINMGRKEQAIDVFKEMFTSQAGKYSEQQILTAGLELQKAGELSIALQAFDRALSTTDKRGDLEPGLHGRGSVLIAQGAFAEGAASIEKLLENYPRSSLTVRATLLLSEAYSQLAKDEADENTRIDIFNKAVVALNKSRRFEKEPAGQARLDLELGRIYTRKAEAEGRFGTKARARDYLGDAISAYQKLILFGNPEEAGVKPHMETAYLEGIPLLLETGNWGDAVSDSDEYLDTFPSGRHTRAIRGFRSKGRVKLAAQGTLPATAAGDATDEEPSDAEEGE